MICSIGIQ